MQISISNIISSTYPRYNGADYISNKYFYRVVLDGGYVEAIGCVKNKLSGYDLSNQYTNRVIFDGGYQEALACSTRAIQELSL